ncbi:MAG TPA: hypothetical protein DEP23_14470 [Ruminococcaceae bacterium]|nr:hypothetical protein [Oscillospiraceae bacterium]
MNKTNHLKQILALFLLICVSACLNSAVAVDNRDSDSDAGAFPQQLGIDEWVDETFLIRYEEVVQNEINILYADMKNGIFAVKNKASGKIWYSTPNDSQLDEWSKGPRKMLMRSQLAVQYIYRGDQLSMSQPEEANSQAGCVSNDTVNVKKLKNGIRVVYDFTELDIIIPVEYTLEKDYLNASVMVREIQEKGDCLVTSIQLLPSFGAGNWEDEGYLLIPDGCGALVRYNSGKNVGTYDKPVYGDELSTVEEYKERRWESVRLPVFGAVNNGNGFLGIITQGEAEASIVGVNGHEESGYNAVSSRFTYRSLSKMILFSQNWDNRQPLYRSSDIYLKSQTYQVRYYFLNAKNSSYTGMATRYRKYLTEEKGLRKQNKTPAINLDLYGSVEKPTSFFGIKYMKKLSLTTYQQAEENIEKLRSAGMSSIHIRYLGWQNAGALNARLPRKASPMSILGGKTKWKALLNFAVKNEVELYPDTDLILHREGASKDAVKTAFGKTVYQQDYLRSVGAVKLGVEGLRLATPVAAESVADKYLRSFQKMHCPTISLSTIGDRLYSSLSSRSFSTREDMQQSVLRILDTYKAAGLEIMLEQANAYAVPYASKIINAPSSCSGYDMFDEEIPFYQIVFHGIVPMTSAPMLQSDSRVNFLKTVETGSELLYAGIHNHSSVLTDTRFDHLYSTTVSFWLEDAEEQYIQYHPILEKIYGMQIVAHETLRDYVTQTTFEGGIRVYVNYGDQAVTVNKMTVPPMGFAIAEGE